jgi:hypothetical protein
MQDLDIDVSRIQVLLFGLLLSIFIKWLCQV